MYLKILLLFGILALVTLDVAKGQIRSGSGNLHLKYSSPPTPIQTVEQKQQLEFQHRQQLIDEEIYKLASDFVTKSNALQKLLLPSNHPNLLSAAQRTNITERIKNLIERKRQLPTHPWRMIDGKPVFVKTAAEYTGFFGKVLQTTSDGVLVRAYSLDSQDVFIRNYPYIYADGTETAFSAFKSKPYSYTSILGASTVVEGFDYGIPCPRPANADEIEAAAFRVTPTEKAAIEKDAASATAEINAAQSEVEVAARNIQDFLKKLKDEKEAALKLAQQKNKDTKDRVLKFNIEMAEKNDAYGLLRMAERYRDGEDVEKDLSKAKVYFSKAIAAGSQTAERELSELENLPAKTSSVEPTINP